MKKYVSFFSVVMLFSITVFSCSINLEGEIDNDEMTKTRLGDFPQIPTFEDSLMAEILTTNIGVIHNEGLDSVLAHNITNATLTPYMFNFCLNRNLLFASAPDSLAFWSNAQYVIYDSLGIERTLGRARPMPLNKPSGWNTYLNRMENVISFGNDTIMGLEGFGLIKNDILSSQTLSNIDKACLLSIAEIANASYHYNFVEVKITPLTSMAGKIVSADLAGAATAVIDGFWCGKYVGLLMFGPEGAVVSITGDAVRGGLLSSGWAAIASWF